MAWTYYTSSLTRGAPLTMSQRNELYDALEERIIAAGNAGDGLHSNMSAVRASALTTDWVKYTWLGTLFTERFSDAMGRISVLYAVADSAQTAYNSTSLRTDVASVLGVSSSNVGNAWSSPFSTALRWNALREGVRLLKYSRMSFASINAYKKEVVNSGGTWVNRRDAVLAQTEALGNWPPTGVQTSKPSGYTIRLVRRELFVRIPAVSFFSSGYGFWGFVNVSAADATDGYSFTYDGTARTGSLSTPGLPAFKLDWSTHSATGSVLLDTVQDTYSNATALDAFEPTSAATKTNTTGFGSLWASPTFTHP